MTGSLAVLLVVLAATAITAPHLFANWAGVGIGLGAVWAIRSAAKARHPQR